MCSPRRFEEPHGLRCIGEFNVMARPETRPAAPRRGRTARWTAWIIAYRRALIIGVHWTLWTLSFGAAFCLRFDFNWTFIAEFMTWPRVLVLLGSRTAAAGLTGGFRGMWRYTGMRDLEALAKSTTLSTILFAASLAIMGTPSFPRSIYIIDWLGTIMVVGGLRFMVRLLREFVAQAQNGTQARRVLIVGAGNTGETLLREIQKNHASRYVVVGLLDDDATKLNASIHGVAVLGPLRRTADWVQRHQIDEIIIAIPTARGRLMRQILSMVQQANVTVRTMPGIDQLIDGVLALQQVREVAIEDLLGRPPVALDQVLVKGFLRDKVVLVTGAGGSIGAELCRQVARFSPKRLVLVEQAEHPLFCMEQELAHLDVAWTSYIGNICDLLRMHEIFAAERPTVVLHAAAHKHVPMMEKHPCEAIKNNILGTRGLADLSDSMQVAHFVMVSTDKAVNPTSVMGACKRVAEMYVQAMGPRSRTSFNVVRFGNVLGSQGSVIPIFKEQIARGGPITVTHPDMQRYFMTIPEACQLVLQAGAMGRGGEVFVLDMGEPVRIVDLARDLIILSGLVPGEDVEIRFVGVRAGEKLFEELSLTAEQVDKTRHPKIFVGRIKLPPWTEMTPLLAELENLVYRGSAVEARVILRRLVPEYCSPSAAPLLPAPSVLPSAPAWVQSS